MDETRDKSRDDMEFGKRTTHESFFAGELKSTRVEFSQPVIVTDKSHALREIMEALTLISDKRTNMVSIVVKADPKTFALKLLTKTYTVDRG